MGDHEEVAALVRQGVALAESGRTDEAVAAFERALSLAPRDARLHWMIGTVLRAGGRGAAARARYEAALMIDPSHPQALGALADLLAEEATALNRQGRGEEAIAGFERAIGIRPGVAAYHVNHGIALRQAGRLPDSLAAFDRALALAPGDPLAHWNRALSLLALGRLTEGWRDYEFRLRLPSAPPPIALPAWDGRTACRVLVRREQGLGDEILFAGCFPSLRHAADGTHAPTFAIECDARLAPLYRRSFPWADIRPVRRPGPGEPEPPTAAGDAEAWIAAGSLPGLLYPSVASFPDRRAYLAADPVAVARWRRWLDGLGPGRKAGLCWRSSQAGGARDRRYARIGDLRPLFALPGLRFVSLQLGLDQAERAAASAALHEAPGLDLREDIDGVAALVAALDLVVTVDSWILSLAGALGVDTRFLAAQRDWATLGTDRMPWLPAVRVRFLAPGDWLGAAQRLAAELGHE